MSQGITQLQQNNLAAFKHLSEPVFRMLVDALNSMEQHQPNIIRSHKTMRFPMAAPQREDIDLPTFDFIDGLLQSVNQKQIPVFQNPRSEMAYYLLLVGAPDEQTLINALTKYHPKCLMIGIGNVHDFAATLDSIDWSHHIQDIRDAGGTVYAIAETDPIQIVETAWRTCRIHNPTQIDHFTAVIQGDAETQNLVAGHIAQTLMLSITQLGFFHDECVMLWNTYQNRKTGKASSFLRNKNIISDTPAFVIASGPSLEHDIEIIRQQQSSAVVVSIASALRPLLDAGITPDFHVELENVYITPKLIELSKDYDLSKIRLVAAASVEPDVLDYFDHAVLYAREALSSYPLFACGMDETLSLPGPTAGNAALSFALESGFKDIYLFGLDLGTRDQNKHHTSGSYYDADEAIAHTDTYNIKIPGNFTRSIWTSQPFLSALKNAGDLIGMFKDRSVVRNCSDGAHLPHAEPMRSKNLSIMNTTDKRTAVHALVERFPSINADMTVWPSETLMPEVERLLKELRSVLTDSKTLLNGEYESQMLGILKLPIGYQDPAPLGPSTSALMLVRGTILSMTLFMERYRNRVGSESKVDDFVQEACAQYSALLNELEETSMRLFHGKEPKQPAPVEARIAAIDRAFPSPIRISRNADCPCGSGFKFKHCHGKVA